jgi:tRNA pseudouridine38-40 synthase
LAGNGAGGAIAVRTLKLTIAYDGTDYAGWQLQPQQATIQGVLEEAFRQITGETTRATASGRTDAGVHALGQVVSLDTETRLSADVLKRALNAALPADIVILEAEEAPPGFHAIRDAVRKRYRYVIYDAPQREIFRRRYCWHYRHRLDVDAMHRAAQPLLGRHDFRSFETNWPNRESSIRTITDISVTRPPSESPDWIHLEVEADGFLYNMVRTIAGTLVEVGRRAQDEQWPYEVVAAQARSAAGPTAPPRGLFLVRVEYDEAQGKGKGGS